MVDKEVEKILKNARNNTYNAFSSLQYIEERICFLENSINNIAGSGFEEDKTIGIAFETYLKVIENNKKTLAVLNGIKECLEDSEAKKEFLNMLMYATGKQKRNDNVNYVIKAKGKEIRISPYEIMVLCNSTIFYDIDNAYKELQFKNGLLKSKEAFNTDIVIYVYDVANGVDANGKRYSAAFKKAYLNKFDAVYLPYFKAAYKEHKRYEKQIVEETIRINNLYQSAATTIKNKQQQALYKDRRLNMADYVTSTFYASPLEKSVTGNKGALLPDIYNFPISEDKKGQLQLDLAGAVASSDEINFYQKRVLEIIIYKFYLEQRYRFTNRDIAIIICKRDSHTGNPTALELKNVDAAIEILRTKEITLDRKMQDKLHKLKIRHNVHNPYLFLKSLGTISGRDNGKAIPVIQGYEIIAEPFYCEYNRMLGKKIEYPRVLDYKAIKGIRSNSEAMILTIFINETLAEFKDSTEDSTYIPMDTVYSLKDAEAVTKKAKFDTRKKLSIILKAQCRELGLKFQADNEKDARKTAGYRIFKKR